MPCKPGKCGGCGKATSAIKYKLCQQCNFRRQRNGLGREERRKDIYLRYKYDSSLEEFEFYWFAQRGKCWICGIKMKYPTKGKGQALDVVAVDHCHKTGKFRALLCNSCNKGLGYFKDNPEFLRVALRYLENMNVTEIG